MALHILSLDFYFLPSKLQTGLHHGKQQRDDSAHCAGYGRGINCGLCRAGDGTENNASGWRKFACSVANSIADGVAHDFSHSSRRNIGTRTNYNHYKNTPRRRANGNHTRREWTSPTIR
mgnify:CR=1 FL=1